METILVCFCMHSSKFFRWFPMCCTWHLKIDLRCLCHDIFHQLTIQMMTNTDQRRNAHMDQMFHMLLGQPSANLL